MLNTKLLESMLYVAYLCIYYVYMAYGWNISVAGKPQYFPELRDKRSWRLIIRVSKIRFKLFFFGLNMIVDHMIIHVTNIGFVAHSETSINGT